jgi:hypothetical protein
MSYTINIKTDTGATHTKFIYPEQKLRCSMNMTDGISGNYIDTRAISLNNKTVEHAIETFWYVDQNNVNKKYRIRDLKYDFKIGRLEVV